MSSEKQETSTYNRGFKDIKNWEGKYQINAFGEVKSIERKVNSPKGGRVVPEKILTQHICKAGYMKVVLCEGGKLHTCLVHRLVANTFLSNYENKGDVNHINGIKTDNRIENLEWNTRKENIQHAVKLGLKKQAKGTQFKNRTKLNEIDIKEIRGLYSSGIIMKDIGRLYDIHRITVFDIIHKRTWAHVE